MAEEARWRLPGFEELWELGAGGFGRVVVARRIETGEHVAIKFLAPQLLTDPGFRQIFRAEAAILRSITSPWVTRFFDYIEQPSGAAIVMELVQGAPLRTLLRSGAALPPESALALLKGALLGLEDAHRAGIVHRDFKPENVLVTPGGASKLCDFGIAVRSGAPDALAAGTAPYMAPEIWLSEPATQAADVYSATATFFECITGSVPFPCRTSAEMAAAHQYAPIPAGAVPAEVQVLIERGLAKNSAHRYPSAGTFLGELEDVAAGAYGPQWESRGREYLAQFAVSALTLMVAALPAGIAVLWGGGAPGALSSGAGLGAGVGTAAEHGAGAAGHAASQMGRGAIGRGVRRLLHPRSAAEKVGAAASAAVIAAAGTTAVVLANQNQHHRGVFTAAQLAAALLPASDFAPGYTLSTDWGGKTGITTETPTASPTAKATFLDSCLSTPGYVTAFAPMSPHAMASPMPSGAKTDNISQFVEMVAQMPPGTAARTFTRYRAAVTGHCAIQHWTVKDPNGVTRYATGTNDVSRPPGLSNDSFFQNEHIDVMADQKTTTPYQGDQFLVVIARYDDVVIELIAAADIDRNDADGYDLVARARRIAANLGLS